MAGHFFAPLTEPNWALSHAPAHRARDIAVRFLIASAFAFWRKLFLFYRLRHLESRDARAGSDGSRFKHVGKEMSRKMRGILPLVVNGTLGSTVFKNRVCGLRHYVCIF